MFSAKNMVLHRPRLDGLRSMMASLLTILLAVEKSSGLWFVNETFSVTQKSKD